MNNLNKIVVAVKGIILNEGKVLIIKRADKAHTGGGAWEPVGGKLEFGEDIEQALIREIKEEVSLNVVIERILYASTFQTDPTRQVVILTYLCRSETAAVILSGEHMDYLWATKEQLKQFLPTNIIQDFKKNHVFTLDDLL